MIEVGFPGLHAQKYVYLCLCGREVEIEREQGERARARQCTTLRMVHVFFAAHILQSCCHRRHYQC